jgi:transcriptional regulator with XRE-family HTH domain
MAKTFNKKELAQLLADYKTGHYSQRDLARKYTISPAYVNKIVKGIDKEDEAVVNAGIAYQSALAQKNEFSVNAIVNAVNEKTKHLQFLHNATLKNISVMAKKLNEEATFKDHLDAQNAIHKAGQTLGVIDQFAKSGDVNVNATAAVQSNNITVEFVD